MNSRKCERAILCFVSVAVIDTKGVSVFKAKAHPIQSTRIRPPSILSGVRTELRKNQLCRPVPEFHVESITLSAGLGPHHEIIITTDGSDG